MAILSYHLSLYVSVRKPGYLNEFFQKKICDVTGGGGGDPTLSVTCCYAKEGGGGKKVPKVRYVIYGSSLIVNSNKDINFRLEG